MGKIKARRKSVHVHVKFILKVTEKQSESDVQSVDMSRLYLC